MKLMRLDNGTWIHPMTVRIIEVVEEHNCNDAGCDCGSGRYPPAVFVTTNHDKHVLPCERHEDAEEMCDKLAALVNNCGHAADDHRPALINDAAIKVMCGNCGWVEVLPDGEVLVGKRWKPVSGCCPKCRKRLIWANSKGRALKEVITCR